MQKKLSVILITKNAADTLQRSLRSVSDIASEIIVVDDYSTDKTAEIASDYNARIYLHHDTDLGAQKQYALSKAEGEWVLALDSDEVVSPELCAEIRDIINNPDAMDGYHIPYKNHFLGKRIRYGGEDYKMLRLFRRSCAHIHAALVHEHFTLNSDLVGMTKGHILHFSYRSLSQMYGKFTRYAVWEGRQRAMRGEQVTLRKIVLDPVHMVWARFVEAKGYKDGLFRLPLDIGFAYMELVMYISVLAHRLIASDKRKLHSYPNIQ